MKLRQKFVRNTAPALVAAILSSACGMPQTTTPPNEGGMHAAIPDSQSTQNPSTPAEAKESIINEGEVALAEEATTLIMVPQELIPKTGEVLKIRDLVSEILKEDNFLSLGRLEKLRVLPKGTEFKILKEVRTDTGKLFVVETPDFPWIAPDHVFVTVPQFLSDSSPGEVSERETTLPDKEVILNRLEEAVGTPYAWAGRDPNGTNILPYLLTAEVTSQLDEGTREKIAEMSQKGVDCSGYLFWATGGVTPSSTGLMAKYGEQLEIEGLSTDKIVAKLKPLDVVVYIGHMGIVGRDGRIYHSTLRGLSDGTGDVGVIVEEADDFLDWVMDPEGQGKVPANSIDESSFVVSRWREQPSGSDE